MSLEEDTELRNLVAQTLENKGILPKIKAELRANVFLALEENINTKEALLKNEELSAFIQVPVGILILNLVREFLEFLNLDFTLSVFDPETKYGADYSAMPREKMIEELNITESKKKGPLLYEIISRIASDSKYGCKSYAKHDNNITLNLNHCNESLNGDSEIASPVLNLNKTYIKNKDNGNATPADPINEINEQNDSIEEELTSNKSSESDNSSSDVNLKKLDQNEKILKSPSDKVDEPASFKPVPENSTEFDLLTFTPVKEVKAKEKFVPEKDKKNEIEIKEQSSNTSILGDLPPLNSKIEAKKNKINEIKAIIDQGLSMDNYDDDDDNFHSSVSSKSSKNERDAESDSDNCVLKQSEISQNYTSNKSERTDIPEEGNLDDDLSDFLNNHSSEDNQALTVDETISKLSNVGDHLESL